MFNIGSGPSCSLHYLLGSLGIRSNFLRINPFSQGCGERWAAVCHGCLGPANKSGGVA